MPKCTPDFPAIAFQDDPVSYADQFIEHFKTLADWQRRHVIIQLLEQNLISFPDLAQAYIAKLTKERSESNAANAKLALFLGMYCGTDKSPAGRNARQLLYDSKNYTGLDGSGFGKMLEDEFNPKLMASNETTIRQTK